MSDETAPQPRIKIAWLAGTLAVFALFAAIAGYSSRMTWDYADYEQQRVAQRYDTLNKVRHDEQALLSPADAQGHPTAEWVDQAKGTVRIPIEEAMAKEIDALKAQPVKAGCEIVVPAPAPSVPASTNAAPAAPGAPVSSTILTPGVINQPVFNTRKANASSAFKGFITYGGVPVDLSATSAPPAAANAQPNKPNK